MAANTNQYVVDASFILSYLLPDEEKDIKTKAIFEDFKNGLLQFIAPQLLPFEVCNSLKIATTRKRITFSQAKRLLTVFFKYGIVFEPVDFSKTIVLAQKHNLTVYDASYLALAKQEKAYLLTTDEKLNAIA